MHYYPNKNAATVATGRPDGRCCDKAERRYCVCEVAWRCAEHGETCVGNHD